MNRVIAIFGGLILCALPAAADVVPGEAISEPSFKNLVPDPGAERLVGEPAKDTWNYYNMADKWVVDKDVVHSGKQSVRLDATDKSKTCGAYTGAPAATNSPVIEFGGWAKVKPTEGDGAKPRFYLQVYLKDGRVLENTATFKAAPTDWQFTGARISVGDAAINYTMLYCLSEGQAGSTWFDDVYIGYGQAPVKKGENLLAQGGFEDASKWRPYGEGFSVDDTAAHSGKRSLRLRAETPYRCYGARCIVKPDGHMDGVLISGWCRSTQKGGRASVTADVHYKDGSVLPGLAIIFPVKAHDWISREEQLTINSGEIDYIVVSAELLFAAGGEVWFDDLSLRPLRK